ncbi:MAG: DUF58 domain-containing protein [Candidatus Promineifilaceae bacterium]|nr:DUF58 domain-containing protein [Candidatus Promineifilaceae bacterium]
MGLTGLIITLLVLAFLLRVDFIYYIVYVCLGVYAFSRWAIPRALSQVRISRDFNDHAFLGESVTVELTWQNSSRLPLPWVEFSESIPPALRSGDYMQRAMYLGGRGERRFTYQVQAGRRGYYRLGPLRLTTGDLFGLVEGKKGYLDANYLTVYPRIIPLTKLGLPSRLPFGTIANQQRLFEDPARPMGTRPYQTGDSQRHINWKVSAHTESLLVKRFEPAISLETAILLNLNQADYERREWRFQTEWAIVTAASLAAHLVNQRQPVGLITNGIDPMQFEGEPLFSLDSGRLLRQDEADDLPGNTMPPAIPPRNGRAHLMKILEHLARIEGGETVPFVEWGANACYHLSWGVTILVVTSKGDEATCQTLHRLVRAGYNPILLAVEPDYNFGEVRKRARLLGFTAYNVTEAAGLDRWRRSGHQV